MSNIVLLKGWNNYFNRKYKAIERTKLISDFISFVDTYNGITLSASNFNENDGVDTFHIFNSTIDASGGITKDIKEYSYLILYDIIGTPIQIHIKSCWFVTKLEKTRGGQYKATLKRDLICDYYDNIKDSPVFVEKAILNNDDPMIFNNEGMNFNQIKQSEHLLKEQGFNKPWIVGYFEKGTPDTMFTQYTSGTQSNTYPDISVLHLNDNNQFWCLRDAIKIKGAIRTTYRIIPGTVEFIAKTNDMVNFVNGGHDAYNPASFAYFSSEVITWLTNERIKKWTDAVEVYKSSLKNHVESYFSDADEELVYDGSAILQYDGATVYDSIANKYYKVSISKPQRDDADLPIIESGTTNNIYPDFVNIASLYCSEVGLTFNIDHYGGGTPRAAFRVVVPRDKYTVSLEDVTPTTEVTIDMNGAKSTFNNTVDSTYNIMAIEYDINTLNLMFAIQKGFGSKMIDMQLLPYCPYPEIFEDGALPSLNIDYSQVKKGSDDYAKLIYVKTCKRTFNIPYSLISVNKKIESQTDFVRLVSPNYNGVYQLNQAKNDGINGFIVDVTFRPISPYIHVSPVFNGVYGSDFGDDRGLICNGDFSIDMTSSSWIEYEIANKNYQNIFDAQIATMDQNNKLDITNQLINGQIGAVAAGVGVGMSTGSWAAGGAMSAASGIANFVDVGMGQAYYKNNKELALDKYNYDLGNIKARGQATKKISTLTNNNKLFPFIEFYTCTDEEKQTLINKIKYNGMTVMRIGTISEFEGRDYEGLNYFQGQLIRCESLNNDTYLIQQIDYELKKGVYL